MKYLNIGILVLSSMSLLMFSSCGNEKKKEKTDSVNHVEEKSTEVSPEVIFENDYAKVVKISLDPGESLPNHEGQSRIIYSLTDYSIEWEEGDEKPVIKSWKKGDVHFHEAGKHSARNDGTTTAEWLVFAKKNNDLPDCEDNTIENDVISVSPDFAQTLFDNNDFKLTQVKLPKGESIPTHSGINRVIYSLSDYNINYESGTQEKQDKQFKAGDVHWHEACMHSLENNGETVARFLVVSYKQPKTK